MKMEVILTTEQAVQIATNAINAAAPMGLGFLHHEAKDYTTEEVAEAFGENGDAYFDYSHPNRFRRQFRVCGDAHEDA